MNQKNGKNSLGLDICFEDEANPIVLFKKWFATAEKIKQTIQMHYLWQLQAQMEFQVSEWFCSRV